MRPRVTMVFFRAPSCGKMVVGDGDVLKTRPLPIELQHGVAGNRAAGFRNMCGRRRISYAGNPTLPGLMIILSPVVAAPGI